MVAHYKGFEHEQCRGTGHHASEVQSSGQAHHCVQPIRSQAQSTENWCDHDRSKTTSHWLVRPLSIQKFCDIGGSSPSSPTSVPEDLPPARGLAGFGGGFAGTFHTLSFVALLVSRYSMLLTTCFPYGFKLRK